jgi:hypothetical protein
MNKLGWMEQGWSWVVTPEAESILRGPSVSSLSLIIDLNLATTFFAFSSFSTYR